MSDRDRQLISRVQSGDSAAFDLLWFQYEPTIRAHCPILLYFSSQGFLLNKSVFKKEENGIVLRFRSVYVPTIAFALIASALSSNSQDKAPAGTNLWPFREGNSWTVQTEIAGKTVSQTIEVTSVIEDKSKTSSTAVLESVSGGTLMLKETYRFNVSGIYRIKGGPDGESKIDPPLPVITYPISSGKKWSWNGAITNKKDRTAGTAAFSVAGPEPLAIPAGTFQAYRIHEDLALRASGVRYEYSGDYWYSPGVGLIRQRVKQGKSIVDSKLSAYKLQ